MGHSLCSFILRQIPRRSPTHNAVYFTTTRLGGYNSLAYTFIFCNPAPTGHAVSAGAVPTDARLRRSYRDVVVH